MADDGATGDRRAFAHDALLEPAPGADERAPGAAVTLALCGSLDHPPPCPLAPHFAGAVREGDLLRVRVLFAAAPADEERVRALLVAALAGGTAPPAEEGAPAGGWRLLSAAPSAVRPEERAHAERLASS